MSSGIGSDLGSEAARLADQRIASLLAALGERSIVLVGLMGSGKTSAGRRLAHRLGLPFVDADNEIESAAGMSITDIFAHHGEAHFRDGERRVIARLLADGPRVIATGGGAFMNEETRSGIAARGISVWLKADFDVLWRRVRRRSHRPLLQNGDPEGTLRSLLDQRNPVYARADITVVSRDSPHDVTVDEIIAALEHFLHSSRKPQSMTTRPKNMGYVPEIPDAHDLARPRERISVELGARTYAILIGSGLIAEAGVHIRRLAPGAACAIVTDANVALLHLESLTHGLAAEGIRSSTVIVEPGEGAKSFEVLAEVCDKLIAARLERGDLIIALGGGVVGDLAGFAAAMLRRGMRFVQVPTTLLAQVDSSVGGKTGINSRHGKNLVGAFHQPSLVLADTGVLETLPPREFRAGYAEIVKYGLIGNADFFARLERGWREVFGGGPERVYAIATSCRAKAAVVARDEVEKGDRALLNLGHTFGHALERVTGYDGARLVHGEAVAIGMACAMRFSARNGLCPREDALRVESHLEAVGLPTRIRDIAAWTSDVEAILDAMQQDKKVEQGALTLVLARRIGDCFIAKNVDKGDVKRFLQDELAGN